MEPANNHERLIAQAVDKKFLEDLGNRHDLIVRDVAMSLDFTMSTSDTRFLIDYIEWRGTRSKGATNSA
jgi:hypothetical protein